MALDGARAARPLRVAICLAHFHAVVGGAERQMFKLARRWASWACEPAVFTRYMPGSAVPAGDVQQIIAAIGSRLRRRLALNHPRFLAPSAEASAELRSFGCELSTIRVAANHDLDRVAGGQVAERRVSS
jgi:hypothetical protein